MSTVRPAAPSSPSWRPATGRRRIKRLALLVAVLGGAGCPDENVLLLPGANDAAVVLPADAADGAALPVEDLRSEDLTAPSRPDLAKREDCTNAPPIHLGGSTAADCAASLAAASLRHALCACDIFAPTGAVFTRSFDSTGQVVAQESAAAIGANGGVSTIDQLGVGGALESGGRTLLGAQTQVDETLRSAGDLQATASAQLNGSAYVDGDVWGMISIEGTLYHPAGAMISPAVMARAEVKQMVALSPPCPCRPQDLLPIGAIIAAHANNNHDALVGLDAAGLQNLAGPLTVELDCGHYYVTGIHSSSTLTLSIKGRVALHVDGAVQVAGGLPVMLGPGAELDLLVANGFAVGGPVIGDPAHPARVRLWIASQQKASFGATAVGALIYAPTTDLGFAASADLYGAAFARRFILDGALTTHFDRALLGAGNLACSTAVQPPVR